MDVFLIAGAIKQYYQDHKKLPADIPVNETEICLDDSCESLVDLTDLSKNEEYLISLPKDPEGSISKKENGSGYTIQKQGNKIIIKAPRSVGEEVIKQEYLIEE